MLIEMNKQYLELTMMTLALMISMETTPFVSRNKPEIYQESSMTKIINIKSIL